MVSQITRRVTLRRSLLLIISFVGAGGQALFFHHNLVYSYPYKVMQQNDFFELIARIGIMIVPAGAVTLAWLLCRNSKEWALPSLSTLLSPVLFLILYMVAHLVNGEQLFYFNRMCGCVPIGQETEMGLWLAGVGICIGALCAIVIELIFRLLDRLAVAD